jgi:hypothetical protein
MRHAIRTSVLYQTEVSKASKIRKLEEYQTLSGGLAEGVGFEPTVRSRVQRFSRPPRSTAPASLRATLQLLGRRSGSLLPPDCHLRCAPSYHEPPALAKAALIAAAALSSSLWNRWA